MMYVALGFMTDGDCGEEATVLMVSSDQERLQKFVDGLLNPDRLIPKEGSPYVLGRIWNTYVYKGEFYHRVDVEPVDSLDAC